MTTPHDQLDLDQNRSSGRRSSGLRAGIAGAAIGAAALVGGLAVVPALAGAQDTEAQTEEVPSDTTTPDATAPASRPDVLGDLVTEGVITSEQADIIRDRFAAARAEWGGGRGHGGPRGGGFGNLRETAAEILGLSEDEIHSAMHDGATLADLATEQGVDVQTLIDALVADVQEQVDAKVADGSITQERADEIVAEAESRIDDVVENGRPMRRGHGSDADDSTDEDPAS